MQVLSSRSPLRENRQTHQQRGAVIALVILLLFAVLVILVFVLDGTRAASAVQQARQYTRLAALAALEEYFDSLRKLPDTDPLEDSKSYDAALLRAQKLSGSNKLFSQESDSPTVVEVGAGAQLSAGFWGKHVNCPDPDPPDPNAKPCFRPEPKGSLSAINRANAFRVDGEFYIPGLVTSLAQSILGTPGVRVRTHAVAAIVPRHGCFLVDNSRSMVAETHDIVTGFSGGFPTAEGADYAFPGNVPASTSPMHNTLWDWMNTNRLNRPAAEVTTPIPTRHYVDDYASKLILGDNSYALSSHGVTLASMHPNPGVIVNGIDYSTNNAIGSSSDYRYLIDAFRKAPDYEGPEPLKSVFNGIRTAIQSFRNRRIGGDKVCLIFYDQNLTWPRVVNLTDNFDYLELMTDFSLGPVAADPVAKTFLTTPDLGVSGLELLIRHGLFPHANSNTNTSLAIREATHQLAAERTATGMPSSDFLVLIGDGLANCSSSQVPNCRNDFAHYTSAMNDIYNLIEQAGGIRDTGIPMHHIAVGPHIRPHTVDVMNSSTGTCYTDNEWRASAASLPSGYTPWDFTSNFGNDSSHYDNADSTNPFYFANRKLYEFSLRSNGIFGPIRPPRAKVSGVCPPINCANAADPDLESVGGQLLRFRDPQCRTYAQQMNDYLANIVGDNPFAVVEVE